jgi:hypothetical protein
LAVSVVCILTARYYFKLDVNTPDELRVRSSRFDPFFIAHRRELKIVALMGLAISLVRLGAACFGIDWPGRWITWPLVLTLIGLLVAGGPFRIPQMTPLKAIEKAAITATLILALLLEWNAFSHRREFSERIMAGLAALLFAWQTLFFAKGEAQTLETPGNVLKS